MNRFTQLIGQPIGFCIDASRRAQPTEDRRQKKEVERERSPVFLAIEAASP